MIDKLANIALVVLAVALVFAGGYLMGQGSNTNATAIKAVLADMTVHANTLERQQVNIRDSIAKISLDLRALKDDDVDKVLRKYGL